MILKPNHEIVSPLGHDDIPSCVPFPPRLDPVISAAIRGGCIKITSNVHVEHIVHLLAQNCRSYRIPGVGLATTGPKTLRKAEKVHLVDRVQHLDHGSLDDLVFQRRSCKRSLPPVGFGNVPPARWSCRHAPRRPPLLQALKNYYPIPARIASTLRRRPQAAFRARLNNASRRRSTLTWCSSALNFAFLFLVAAWTVPFPPPRPRPFF